MYTRKRRRLREEGSWLEHRLDGLDKHGGLLSSAEDLTEGKTNERDERDERDESKK